jgi:hypothetical protein
MFRHDGDVVPAALVLVGAVFAVLGGLGRQVDSVNLKEGGLTYSLWRDEVLEKTTPEEVLEAATSAPPPVQRKFERDHAVAMVTDRAYEDAIFALLKLKYGDDAERSGTHRQPDFIVRRGGKTIFVECAYNRDGLPIFKILTLAASYGDEVAGVVYVSPGGFVRDRLSARSLAEKSGVALELVYWDGQSPESAEHVTNAVEKILAG